MEIEEKELPEFQIKIKEYSYCIKCFTRKVSEIGVEKIHYLKSSGLKDLENQYEFFSNNQNRFAVNFGSCKKEVKLLKKIIFEYPSFIILKFEKFDQNKQNLQNLFS